MFKYIVGFFFAVWIVFSFVDSSRESEAQAQRTIEQTQILVSLESLHDANVSKLVDEWRAEYPNPSAERLTELKLLAERVKADPKSANKYTAKAKEKHLASLPYEPVVGGWGKQTSGLDGAAPDKTSSSPK
ncbi:MAG: hypothetical protein KAX55_01490 [Propionivibrio sp.]|nr:hypothetical protein [Propionivibrio sp.]